MYSQEANEEIVFDNHINESHVSLDCVCGPGIEKKINTNKTDGLTMTGFWFKDSSPAVYNSLKVKLRGSPSFHEATGNRALCNSFSNPNVNSGIAQSNDSQQRMQQRTD